MAENKSAEKVGDKVARGGNGAAEHSRVVREILAKCGARPDCRLWKNETGVGRAMDSDRVIHFGLKGSADILGIHGQSGRLLCFEVKTGKARQSKEQVAFQDMIEKFNGLYFIVSSADDVVSCLSLLGTTYPPWKGRMPPMPKSAHPLRLETAGNTPWKSRE